ncbi:polysaccharide pyruvyl transferase family protein [Bacteroides fluxus]|uniref:Polysaccharide pyruvyl transferase domain-containing protein n=1 Tax=Bacteroides fluxus YIT 12057 TaxID=763034 RepID=F3PUJ8_9BACE|nr:polysaccharide pyruvyl transferase family protein [Bacteroides fluxus]EGF56069.1 hypothetical protein HMPREF9446_02471 [Bacteroides fluxus YIT 12057]
MRIAIITLPLHANYGGILQAYALQNVLKQMGHTVETIQTPSFKRIPLWRKPLTYIKRFILKYIFGRNVRVFFEQWYNITDPSLVKHMKCFIEEYISIRLVSRYTDIKEDEYEAFIVGSDQIWRPIYFEQSIDIAYLSFTRDWGNVKRIAYAASFGTDKWEYTRKQIICCSKLIKSFDAISVREYSAVELCRQHLNCNVLHVLDPTMLLDVNDYCKLFMDKQLPPTKGELLTYILDENIETEDFVYQLANNLDYRPFRANSHYEDFDAPLSERVQPPVEQWLKGFYDAKFIVTDSFHATVFSILFKKPFIVICNEERGGARLKSLLGMFGLERHLIVLGEEINFDFNFNLDNGEIDINLNRLRTESINFLTSSLR